MRVLPWLLLAACAAPPEPVTGLPNLPGGNPLVPEVAAFPFPSSLYTVADAASHTGRRVALPADVLPDGLTPELFADHDGWSRIPALLTWFADGVDPATLPTEAESVAADAAVRLVRLPDGEAWPLVAELDGNARGAWEQALILRPARALDPDTAYAVVLSDRLRAADGGALPVERAFEALRDGLPTDSPEVEAQRGDFDGFRAVLDTLGLAPETVIAGWVFHTRSETQVTGPLQALQAEMVTAPLGAWVPTRDEVVDGRRLIEGHFGAPEFLDASRALVRQGDGAVRQGTRQVEVSIGVPLELTGTRPVVLFGHGFFSAGIEGTRGSFFDLVEQADMSAVAIDFEGFSEGDIGQMAGILAGRYDGLPAVIDQQVQNVATFTALSRLVSEQLATTVRLPDGRPAFDGDRVVYAGASNGGTQGLTILSTSPNITRGALVVPGGGWTHMLQRAVQWNDFAGLFEDRYDPLELQLVVSALQGIFDPADSLNYVSRLTRDRFDGAAPQVEVSLHVARYDCQVANMVTEWVQRTASIPTASPAPWSAWGVAEVPCDQGCEGPVAFWYDEGVAAPPPGNVPPSADNGTHGHVRTLGSYKEQVAAFLEDGTLRQVCDGACDPD